MAVILNPYIHFNGQAEEVINFYKSVFGGEVEISRYGDQPPVPGQPDIGEFKNHVMHSVLKNDKFQLMVSDSGPMGPGRVGENISISLSGDESDDAELSKYFEALCEGGKITVPMDKAPWGDKFGMVVDKYGINWLVNIAGPKPAA